jgi:putative ABC transport system permease protein
VDTDISDSLRYDVTLINSQEYQRLTGEKIKIENEILVFDLSGAFASDELIIMNEGMDINLKVNEILSALPFIQDQEKYRKLVIIMEDPSIFGTLYDNAVKRQVLSMNYTGEDEKKLEFANGMSLLYLSSDVISDYYSKDIENSKWYSYFGGGLFLCMFVGSLLLITLVLIMYIKQITEGIEDRKQFELLKNVGIDERQVASIINTQVRLMFFLPLLLSISHIIVAYNLLCRMLKGFHMTDSMLVLISIVILAGIFTVVYWVIYKLTARRYYRLISKKIGL